MKTRKLVLLISIAVSMAVLSAPIAINSIFWGDDLFDAVFSESLGGLPVSKAGRVMPMSSAAADVLRSVGGKSSAKIDGEKMSATKWIWNLAAHPEKIGSAKIIRSDNKDWAALLKADGRYFSYSEILKNYESLYKAAVSSEKTPRSDAAASILNAGAEYSVAENALAICFEESMGAADSIRAWGNAVADAAKELADADAKKREPDNSKLVKASDYLSRLRYIADFENDYSNAVLRIIHSSSGFKSVAQALLERPPNPSSMETAEDYAKLRDAIASGDKPAARKCLGELILHLRQSGGINFFKLKVENFFNLSDPFLGGFILYTLAAAAFSAGMVLRKFSAPLRGSGAVFLLVAVAVHILAIIARMYIQGRPPVTNLYSSIVFTGAAAAALGYVMYIKKAMPTLAVSASFAGFISLLVAMNLPYGGDTMGQMRAVLNSNFWLTLHVVTIMIGYCGVFLAGFSAAFRLVANIFERNKVEERTSLAAGNVYAILCFALLFSFAGTMLGGIWADMSWGRFWGWDPKENGALMIVLWCAAAIHARVMRVVGDKTFLALAVFGNIIAAWAWFGVNLMGVGLHAYGFIDGGWFWFFVFVISQAAVIPLAFIKKKKSAISLEDGKNTVIK